jgi:hypothetical protein
VPPWRVAGHLYFFFYFTKIDLEMKMKMIKKYDLWGWVKFQLTQKSNYVRVCGTERLRKPGNVCTWFRQCDRKEQFINSLLW